MAQNKKILIDIKVSDKGAIASIGKTDKAVQNLATSTKNLSKASKQNRAQSGLNNAILIETGRVASDAAYGMQGIANNLGRLIELGQEYSRTGQGGLKGAFKELTKSLMGAGGIIIAVQLLLSFMPKIIAKFKEMRGVTFDLAESLSEASKTVSDTSGKFEIYVKTLQSSKKSQEEQKDAIKALNEEFPDYIQKLSDAGVTLDDVANKTEKAIELNDLYRDSIMKLALSRAAMNKIEEQQSESLQFAIDAQLELREEYNTTLEDAEKITEKFNKRRDEISDLSIRKQTRILEQEFGLRERKIVNLTSSLKKEQDIREKNIQALLEFVDIDLDDKTSGKDSAEFQTKIFEAKYTDFEKIEQRYRERSQKSELRTNQEILAQTQQNEMAKIDILEQAFVRKQQLRLADYKDQLAQDVKSKNITQEEADVLSADADAEYLKSVQDAAEKRKSLEVEVLNFISSLRTLQIRKDANIAEKEYDKRLEILRKFRLDSADILKLGFGDEEKYYIAREDTLSKDIEQQKRVVDAYEEGSLLKAQAQVELFNLEDKLRQNSLQKEIASIEEKKRINTAYVNYTMGIGQIMSKLAGENEALQKAALVLEKGAAIGGIVVDAHSSIARARANTGVANTAAMSLPIPFSAIQIAANEAMFAKETLMTKVGAGIGIANILATTISSFKTPSVSSSGGGGGNVVQAPDFNVVGTSSTDQLAQAVSGKVNEPLKAYVVGKDITNQQELDRNTISTAGLG